MKIGVLTLWESLDNYGQQLQCWALQTVLKNIGHTPYLIRYDTSIKIPPTNQKIRKKSIAKLFLVYPILNKLRLIVKKRRDIKWKGQYNEKNKLRDFVGFREKYINTSTNKYDNIFELRSNPPQADVYITGSDQVWSYPLNLEESKSYYLDFGCDKTKRISYAASFSMPKYPVEWKRELHKMLQNFEAVSVRERTGVLICKSVGIKAQLVLDPTLLLTKADYNSLIQQNQICKNQTNYIYIYHLNINSREEIKWKEIKTLSLEENINVFATTSSGQIIGKELLKDVRYDYPTIYQWLANIFNAKFVVTTSFHGVVFCIIGHINFVWIPLVGRSGKGNSRVVDLLEILGLGEHIYSHQNPIKKIFNLSVDWKTVDSKVDMQKHKSMSFIKESLNRIHI